MKNTTARGDLSELEIAIALTRSGLTVLRPLSSGLRYDLAVDNGDGTFMRIECKTGMFKDGVIYFRAHNADARRPNGVPYWGQIEAFGVYCPQLKQAFLIPSAALRTSSTARLRVGPTRNGQVKNVQLADPFRIG